MSSASHPRPIQVFPVDYRSPKDPMRLDFSVWEDRFRTKAYFVLVNLEHENRAGLRKRLDELKVLIDHLETDLRDFPT